MSGARFGQGQVGRDAGELTCRRRSEGQAAGADQHERADAVALTGGDESGDDPAEREADETDRCRRRDDVVQSRRHDVGERLGGLDAGR